MEIDYSFLGIGNLYQVTTDVLYKVYARFGVEKGDSVYITARVHIRDYGGKSLELAVLNRDGLEITKDDCVFLRKIIEAEGCIRYAQKLLKEAANG